MSVVCQSQVAVLCDPTANGNPLWTDTVYAGAKACPCDAAGTIRNLGSYMARSFGDHH